MLPDVHLFRPVQYHQVFSMAPSPLQRVVPIPSLLRIILAVLAHPYLPFHVLFSNDFRHSSTPFNPMQIEKPNCGNAQGTPCSLVVLVSSKLLQYRTERHCTLLHDHGRSSKGSCMARACHRNLSLPQPHMLKAPALAHQVQQPRSHHPSHCGLVLFCFSAAHLPHTPMDINTGTTYVQSFCFSHLPLLHQSCFLSVRLVQCIELDHANCRESTTLFAEDKSWDSPRSSHHGLPQYYYQLISYYYVIFQVILAEFNLGRARYVI
ncbi:hypothetical protein C8R48DRAFT_417633 [Suillus tomentosus]|nr:hypothetical protein C8R48DRAFT_417633 [Suillus tomentosus]